MVDKKEALLVGGAVVVLAVVGGVVATNVQSGEKASLPVQQFVLEPVTVDANNSAIVFRHTAGDPTPYENMNVTVRTDAGQTVVFGPPTSLNDRERVANRDHLIVVSTSPPRILVSETRVTNDTDARMHEVYSSTRSGRSIDLSKDDIDTVTVTFTNTTTGDVVFETSFSF